MGNSPVKPIRDILQAHPAGAEQGSGMIQAQMQIRNQA